MGKSENNVQSLYNSEFSQDQCRQSTLEHQKHQPERKTKPMPTPKHKYCISTTTIILWLDGALT